MNKKWESCISSDSISVVDAMCRIQENAKGVLYIVDENGKFIGSVTDGDLRRWVIKSGDIKGVACQFLNREARFIREDQVDDAKDILKEYKVRSLPVIDADRRIIDIVFDDFYSSTGGSTSVLKDVPVIIMAGGKGTRLYPYTKILPKPLIPIGDIPIIERIMNQFNKYGTDRQRLQGSRETALDPDKVDELLLLISNELGKDNVILKRKHGIDQSQYPESVKNTVTIYEDENMPWELICLNGDLNNCILISVPSSAIILPYTMGVYW